VRFDVAGWPVVGAARRMRGVGAGWEWPAGHRPRLALSDDGIVLGRGTVARQTGTVRFRARVLVDVADRRARPGVAVTGSEGNAVGIELRGGRAVAWRTVDGRRTGLGSARLQPGRALVNAGRVVLRVTVDRRVRLQLVARGRTRTVGRLQPPPRWANGSRVALTVSGRHGRARFRAVAVDPLG